MSDQGVGRVDVERIDNRVEDRNERVGDDVQQFVSDSEDDEGGQEYAEIHMKFGKVCHP